ncbi:hypothetical protein [Mucisphaera calidilacus]|uniref:Uncharacterized protein n=1 Tax=Mucisphaera calidilacus TaxID=2527982 RepID=A0A518BZF7_9BACT|nr:hypothetical protein [Mucisphaera calidilacus]QDU72345.1 hypothetical protein Pan265_22100 [Mucisphaera calidilacus]
MNKNAPKPDGPEAPLPVRNLTWTALLAQWVEFAQAAVALPDNDEGSRWRRATPDLISLQAIWFALQHLHELPPEQQALGRDRAAVQIASSTRNLNQLWSPEPLPENVASLVEDAQSALSLSDPAQRDKP